MIGRSRKMVEIFKLVGKVARSRTAVLIHGESGTGKEIAARSLHALSTRAQGPFVAVNCAAIPSELIESELFGHVKGSFTGALEDKVGKFAQADGGELFLDEVGDMSLRTQSKVLRVLEEQRFVPVGSGSTLTVDVRVIAATNNNLLQEIDAGRFRDDLFYRLNVVNLTIPPLRHRKEDIPLLAQHFLRVFSEKNRKQMKGFTPQAMDRLLRYDWPGNVRELMNAVERGVVLSRTEFLDEEQLPLISETTPLKKEAAPVEIVPGHLPLEEVEKATILNTLEAVRGNKSEAARRLGITRKTLHAKLKKYGILGG